MAKKSTKWKNPTKGSGNHGNQPPPPSNQKLWLRGKFVEGGKPPVLEEYIDPILGVPVTVYGIGWARGMQARGLWAQIV